MRHIESEARVRRIHAGLGLLLLSAALAACGNADASSNHGDTGTETDATVGVSGAASATGENETEAPDDGQDNGQGDDGTSGTESESAGVCSAESFEPSATDQPVDIILVVDTSSTMNAVSDAVEANLSSGLAEVLGQSGLDYRVIVLASHGNGADLCIGPPLGGSACSPAAPLQYADRFFHYVGFTGSSLMMANILDWYTQPDASGLSPNGWQAWLRPSSRKVFLAITDALSMTTDADVGTWFDAELVALDPAQFGTEDERNYVFHTISGLAQKDNPTEAWLPSEPIVETDCVGVDGKEPGQPLQRVSILTGGLRYPLCEYGSFGTIFTAMAEHVVDTATLCTIPFPEGEDIDTDTLEVRYYEAGAGDGIALGAVAGVEQCAANSFYVQGEAIHLCPDTCVGVQSDLDARIEVTYGCLPTG